MGELITTTVEINGHSSRVWRKGTGPRLGYLAGYGGLPKWMPFLDRLAANYEVVVPSLPGFPGATGHADLVSHLDWLVAVRKLLDASGLSGANLAGSSVGASFVAEVAALWPDSVKRIAMIAPFGIYDEAEPPTDPWAQKARDTSAVLCAKPEVFDEMKAVPADGDPVEWPIEQVRAAEAAARIFWPLGDSGLEKRLPMITAPTLLMWGEKDRIMPRSYADKIKAAINGPCEISIIANAGHLAELDEPEAVATQLSAWFASP